MTVKCFYTAINRLREEGGGWFCKVWDIILQFACHLLKHQQSTAVYFNHDKIFIIKPIVLRTAVTADQNRLTRNVFGMPVILEGTEKQSRAVQDQIRTHMWVDLEGNHCENHQNWA